MSVKVLLLVNWELTQHLRVLEPEGKEAVNQQMISYPLAKRKRVESKY